MRTIIMEFKVGNIINVRIYGFWSSYDENKSIDEQIFKVKIIKVGRRYVNVKPLNNRFLRHNKYCMRTGKSEVSIRDGSNDGIIFIESKENYIKQYTEEKNKQYMFKIIQKIIKNIYSEKISLIDLKTIYNIIIKYDKE